MARLCSILIVTLNEARHLPRLRQALRGLRLPPALSIETIVIDGGSNDGTPELARGLEFDKVVVLPGASIPACRNRALKEARGDWLAFLDGDCEPASDWLESAAPYLSTDSPRIIGWPVEPPTPGTWVQRAWHAHWLHKNPASLTRQPVRHEAFRLITTRNMLFTRAVLKIIPAFDEQLSTGEDTDFVFRAQMQGVDVLAVPTLKVTHHGEAAALADFFRQQLWHANRGSYQKIVRATAGRIGGNVIIFTAAFFLSLCAGLAGLMLAAACSNARWLLLWLPAMAILALPAATICARQKNLRHFFPLIALYAAYGLARTLDLLGFARNKVSWKSPKQGDPSQTGGR